MLKKSQITDIQIHSDKWRESRLGRLTSSKKYRLMSERVDSRLTYIREKVGEEITGISSEDEVDTEDTKHGILHEPEAIRRFAEEKGFSYLITQKLIIGEDTRFSCTPDAIVALSVSPDGSEYDVETLEVKCPTSYSRYIELFECDGPLDILKVRKDVFWQVCDQMYICGAIRGYLAIYQPFFRVGGFKIFEFRKALLMDHFRAIKQINDETLKMYNSIRQKLIG